MMPALRPTYQERLAAWRLVEIALSGNLVAVGQKRDWCKRLWWTHSFLKSFLWSTLSVRMYPVDFELLHDAWTEFRIEAEKEMWKRW
jgi:hypothetical protein